MATIGTRAPGRRPLDDVSADQLMSYVHGIARWVRLSGSPDERKAIDYVKGLLDSYGLKTHVIEHDAYISLPGPATLTTVGPAGGSVPCITHAMSAATDGLEADVVWAGPGQENADLKGKVALSFGLATGPKVAEFETRGAIGQIFVNATQRHEMIISNVWGSPTSDTFGLLPTTPVVSVAVADGEQLKELALAGNLRVRITTEVDTGWRKTPILIGDLAAPGTEDFVMFSGHIDSWHYGAMDNGAANAIMIETARVLAPHRDKLQRGLRLAFWSGHSHGRYSGSTWYSDHYFEEMYDRCVAYVNVDSTGGKGATVISQAIVMQEALALAKQVVEEVTGEQFDGERPKKAGDQSFWGVGVPSIFMDFSEQPKDVVPDEVVRTFVAMRGTHGKAAGLGWWWHTPEDLPDKIDPVVLLRDAQVYVDIIDRLLSSPIIPFNYANTARELKGVVAELITAAGSAFDLDLVLERINTLEARCERLNSTVARLAASEKAGDSAVAERANACIKQLGRLLIPMSYTRNGPFEHDLAGPMPPLPTLQPVRNLAKLEPGSNEAMCLSTKLCRARNQVNFTLRLAIQAVDAVLVTGE